MLAGMKVDFLTLMIEVWGQGTSEILTHLRCMNFALFDSYRKLMEIGTNWVDKWELDNLCWMEVFQMVKLSYIHCFLAVLRSQIVLEVPICSRFDICFLIF